MKRNYPCKNTDKLPILGDSESDQDDGEEELEGKKLIK